MERLAWEMGHRHVAGVDEVGLGPLAGPVVAAAVILPAGAQLPGLDDSKRLSPTKRERLEVLIRRRAVACAVHAVAPEVVDEMGLTRARQLAMSGAVAKLEVPADYLLVDAWEVPDLPLPQMCVVKGDGICASIMAASVIAKVHRDRLMVEYDRQYPGYGFAVHKGYGTAAHLRALAELGPAPIHRRSWAPVRALAAARGGAGGCEPEGGAVPPSGLGR
ncbi:MAG TPA: ribonuclease HII [Candidatus Dormibacteraeota bacterium]|nr:ribonuclease HII [Candidatus Dormibacteraeota bacterium]